MSRVVLWTTVTVFFLSLIEAAILSNIAFLPVIPDLVLLVIVYVAFKNPAATGTLAGFISGILLDFLSASPIGLNAFTKTLAGYVAGRFSGAFNLDRLLISALMGFAATALKALTTWALSFFFGPQILVYRLAAPTFWLEVLANVICAPIVFGMLSRFPTLFVSDARNGE